jgi:hypothetical protein
MRLRLAVLPLAVLVLATSTLPAQTRLVGRVDGNQYVSPTGAYRITIPVLPELGGRIVDTPEVMTSTSTPALPVSRWMRPSAGSMRRGGGATT